MRYDEEEEVRAAKYRNGPIEIVKYWNWAASKYGKDRGLKAVGFLGAPDSVNEYQDFLQRNLVIPLLRKQKVRFIMDAGCGIGRWTERTNRMGFLTIGCDVSRVMIKVAKERLKKIPFIVCSLSHLCFRNEVFDTCLSITVLQHITNQVLFEAAVEEIARVTKKGGIIILLEQIGYSSGSIVESRPLESYAKILGQCDCTIVKWRGVSVMPYQSVLRLLRRMPRFIVKLVSISLFVIDFIITGTKYFSRRSSNKLMLIVKEK